MPKTPSSFTPAPHQKQRQASAGCQFSVLRATGRQAGRKSGGLSEMNVLRGVPQMHSAPAVQSSASRLRRRAALHLLNRDVRGHSSAAAVTPAIKYVSLQSLRRSMMQMRLEALPPKVTGSCECCNCRTATGKSNNMSRASLDLQQPQLGMQKPRNDSSVAYMCTRGRRPTHRMRRGVSLATPEPQWLAVYLTTISCWIVRATHDCGKP